MHPELPPEGGSLGHSKERAAESRARLRAMSQDAGLEMNFRDVVSNSRLALEAAEFARDQDKLDEFHRAVLHAYWVDGKDIGDDAVLAEIGGSVGLEANLLRAAAVTRTYRERVDYQIEVARELGIGGVPAFIFNERFLLQGAQPFAVFEQVMERLLQEGGE